MRQARPFRKGLPSTYLEPVESKLQGSPRMHVVLTTNLMLVQDDVMVWQSVVDEQ